ncbi:MAG: hypothetical protein ACXVEI_01575 [Actinomycetota bacterium]
MKDLDELPVPALWARVQARAQDEDTGGSEEAFIRPSAGRRTRAALLAAVVFGVAGIFAWQALRPLHQVAPSAAPRAHDAWSTLHRPLRLPDAIGGTCPASPIVTIEPIGGGFSPGSWPAIGEGPAYVVAEPRDGMVLYPRDLVGGGWYGLKTIFTVDTSYRGPLLIRVAQIDGSGGIGLQSSSDPLDPVPTELRVTTAGGDLVDWQSFPEVTLVRSAGCFAYQIDGTTFSEVIVFSTRDR